MEAPLLDVRDLTVAFPSRGEKLYAVRGASFTLGRGEALGLAGESGSGKSALASAIMGILPDGGKTVSGEVLYRGENILSWSEKRLRAWRGAECAMIFQNPASSFDPLYTVGRQVAEAARIHLGVSRAEADERAMAALASARMDDCEKRFRQYPYELSGGQLQRAAIAAALVCSPALLIADEPTTSLDATVQSEILSLLAGLREKTGMALLLISHDLAVCSGRCEKMLVMYGGALCERGRAEDVLLSPAHEYTRELLRCSPRGSDRLFSIPGSPPDMRRVPAGCAFFPRCCRAMRVCGAARPPWTDLGCGHSAACWALCDKS